MTKPCSVQKKISTNFTNSAFYIFFKQNKNFLCMYKYNKWLRGIAADSTFSTFSQISQMLVYIPIVFSVFQAILNLFPNQKLMWNCFIYTFINRDLSKKISGTSLNSFKICFVIINDDFSFPVVNIIV